GSESQPLWAKASDRGEEACLEGLRVQSALTGGRRRTESRRLFLCAVVFPRDIKRGLSGVLMNMSGWASHAWAGARSLPCGVAVLGGPLNVGLAVLAEWLGVGRAVLLGWLSVSLVYWRDSSACVWLYWWDSSACVWLLA
ncbi:hypothetical protein ANANG_G00073670, partial [Anguilla anguilla]